jgi:hypothetical protein
MAIGVQVVTVEIRLSIGTLFYANMPFRSSAADTPPSTYFPNRLLKEISFRRQAGTFFWNEASRGRQSFGVIELANNDKAFNSVILSSAVVWRDAVVIIKRGDVSATYGNLTTVATVIVDKTEATADGRFLVYVKDKSALLERALQTSLYPTTHENAALRGKPKPIALGICYQVPVEPVYTRGKKFYDVHENDLFCAIHQVLDKGTTIQPTIGYARATPQPFGQPFKGFEVKVATAGQIVANVIGAGQIISDVNVPFESWASQFDSSDGTETGTVATRYHERLGYLQFPVAHDNAVWAKTNVTVPVTNALAPDGTATADQISETAVNAGHYLLQFANISGSRSMHEGGTYTFTTWLKPNGRTFARVQFNVGGPASDNNSYVTIDVSLSGAGAVSAVSGSQHIASSISAAANGFYRVAMTFKMRKPEGSPYAAVYVANALAGVSYLGVVGTGLYIWGSCLHMDENRSRNTYAEYGLAHYVTDGLGTFTFQNSTPAINASYYYVAQIDVIYASAGTGRLRYGFGGAVAGFPRHVGITGASGPGRYTQSSNYPADAGGGTWYLSMDNTFGGAGDFTVDHLRFTTLSPIRSVIGFFSFLASSDANWQGHGPLALTDIDTAGTLATIPTSYLGLFLNEPIQIADALDQVMQSFGGWWYIDQTGKLCARQLLAPTGTPTLTLLDKDIPHDGVRVYFDDAPGLSNRILSKRNWHNYSQDEIVTTYDYASLSPTDKDADVTLSDANFKYDTVNVGFSRQMQAYFGEVTYAEFTYLSGAIGVGYGNGTTAVTGAPGGGAGSIAIYQNGNVFVDGVNIGALYGALGSGDTWQICVDGRPTAREQGAEDNFFSARSSQGGSYTIGRNNATAAGYWPPDVDNRATWPYHNGGYNFSGYFIAGSNAAGASSGRMNSGASPFYFTPPAETIPVAWHRSLITQPFRYVYQSTIALSASYQHAVASPGDDSAGVPTLHATELGARTECDRWATMYSVDRYMVEIDAFIQDSSAVDTLNPGDLLSVTYAPLGWNAKLIRLIGVEGNLGDNYVKFLGWY